MDKTHACPGCGEITLTAKDAAGTTGAQRSLWLLKKAKQVRRDDASTPCLDVAIEEAQLAAGGVEATGEECPEGF